MRLSLWEQGEKARHTDGGANELSWKVWESHDDNREYHGAAV